MHTPSFRIGLAALTAGIVLAAGPDAAAQRCPWTVTGTVLVHDTVFNVVEQCDDPADPATCTGTFAHDVERPLAGARVHVDSAHVRGAWLSQGWVEADDDGDFSHTFQPAFCGRKYVRVRVQLRNGELRVRKNVSGAVRHHTLAFTATNAFAASPAALGDLVVDEDFSLDSQRAASIFAGLGAVIEWLDDAGVPFLERLNVVYPAGPGCSPGCADPIGNKVVLQATELDTPSGTYPAWFQEGMRFNDEMHATKEIVHEAMHFWLYQRTDADPLAMVDALIGPDLEAFLDGGPFHFDTHDAWETPYTALNEGLVEAAARNLMQQVFGLPQESCDEPTCSDLADPSDANHIAPYTRPALADLSPAVMEIDDGAGGLDIVHTDNGVRNLLHLLQTDVLHHMSFGTLADGVSNEDANGHPRPQPVMFLANPCSEPDAFDFVELLEAFDGGWLTVDDGIDELVELLSSEYPDRLDAARADVLRELGHANGTGEALDLICDEATPVPTDYGRFIGKRSKGDERRPRARAARGR